MKFVALAILILSLAACTSPQSGGSGYMPRTPQFGAVQPKPNHSP